MFSVPVFFGVVLKNNENSIVMLDVWVGLKIELSFHEFTPHNDIINFGKMHKTNLSLTILGVTSVSFFLRVTPKVKCCLVLMIITGLIIVYFVFARSYPTFSVNTGFSLKCVRLLKGNVLRISC